MKMLPIALATIVLWAPMDSIAGDASENFGQLPEIVVTAQKRAENLQRVPISVDVFDKAAFD